MKTHKPKMPKVAKVKRPKNPMSGPKKHRAGVPKKPSY